MSASTASSLPPPQGSALQPDSSLMGTRAMPVPVPGDGPSPSAASAAAAAADNVLPDSYAPIKFNMGKASKGKAALPTSVFANGRPSNTTALAAHVRAGGPPPTMATPRTCSARSSPLFACCIIADASVSLMGTPSIALFLMPRERCALLPVCVAVAAGLSHAVRAISASSAVPASTIMAAATPAGAHPPHPVGSQASPPQAGKPVLAGQAQLPPGHGAAMPTVPAALMSARSTHVAPSHRLSLPTPQQMHQRAASGFVPDANEVLFSVRHAVMRDRNFELDMNGLCTAVDLLAFVEHVEHIKVSCFVCNF